MNSRKLVIQEAFR